MNSQVAIPVKLKLDGLEAETLNRLYADSGASSFDEFILNVVRDYLEAYG